MNRWAYALRDTAEKCFDRRFLAVRQHPSITVSVSMRPVMIATIPVTFFPRYLPRQRISWRQTPNGFLAQYHDQ